MVRVRLLLRAALPLRQQKWYFLIVHVFLLIFIHVPSVLNIKLSQRILVILMFAGKKTRNVSRYQYTPKWIILPNLVFILINFVGTSDGVLLIANVPRKKVSSRQSFKEKNIYMNTLSLIRSCQN